jgi:hypothetical protein
MESVYRRIKRQRNLMIVFFIVLIVTLSILYFGYFKKEKGPQVSLEIPIPEKKVEIDFSIFENPILKELQPLEKIGPPIQDQKKRKKKNKPIK